MQVIRINEKDNVAVAVKALRGGSTVVLQNVEVKAIQRIPAGHKIALIDIKAGEPIVKYGYCIGFANVDIKAGEWVHTHNIKTALSGVEHYSYEPISARKRKQPAQVYFQGFVRSNGEVGIRNEVWIIPTVGCVNSVANELEKRAEKMIRGTVDGVAAFPHPYGCSQLGGDQENTRRILSNLITHPNAAAVLVVGLGCENSNIEVLKQYIGDYDENRIKFLSCQDSGDEIDEGIRLLSELIDYAAGFRREQVEIGKLVVGLKCGGSDGLSGITANPLVGRFSDMLTEHGGTTILTEVPEMFGAETILMNRAKNEEVFDKTVKLINDFKCYYKSMGQPIYENPSPGNKEGGISTLEDKSLGCTQKSGTSEVTDVLNYGDKATVSGLNLLCAPGNDLVASTALAASGSHVVLFTTGRGTPFASPVPTIKISSNSALAEKKANWIDFNAGPIADDKTIDDLAELLFKLVIDVASGKQVKSEIAGYHDMAIFKTGVTL